MILDRLENAASYYGLGRHFAAGFDYLRSTDFTKLAEGRYPVQGDDVVAMVQRLRSKRPPEGKWEAHRVYADIQYVIAGPEAMGIAPLSEMHVSEAYIPDRDVEFFTGSGQTITVPAGYFTIFLPQDVHMPCLSVGAETRQLFKVVMKIRLG